MTAGFGEFHDEMRAVARDLLAKKTPQTSGGNVPEPPDRQILAGAGWLGLEVSEALDGGGATFAEVAIILHEMGRAATASHYLGSAVLGIGALNLLEPGGRDDLLRQVAAGAAQVAVAVPTGEDDVTLTAAPFRLKPSPRGARVYGQAAFVPDAGDADRLLLLAHGPDTVPVLVDVARGAPGLGVTPQPMLDATRRFGAVSAEGVEVREASVWRFTGDPGASGQRLLDRGALAVACDSLGLAEAMMEATVAYAGLRHQFGRPIGSFQAVKHACADMFVQVMVCRELISSAVRAVAEDTAEVGVAVSMAKSHVCAAAVDVVGKAMQLHGGIGYTWESGVHVYLKRAALDRSLFGSPRAHRARLAVRYPGRARGAA
jgi:alkylation response protein AidB-like acyl-CoA dehydrogenase